MDLTGTVCQDSYFFRPTTKISPYFLSLMLIQEIGILFSQRQKSHAVKKNIVKSSNPSTLYYKLYVVFVWVNVGEM